MENSYPVTGGDHHTDIRRWHRIAASLLLPLSILDISLTYWALSIGGQEANPIAAWLIDQRAMPLIKFMLPTVILLGAWKGSTHTLRLVAASWAVVGIYLCVCLVNVMTINRLI